MAAMLGPPDGGGGEGAEGVLRQLADLRVAVAQKRKVNQASSYTGSSSTSKKKE